MTRAAVLACRANQQHAWQVSAGNTQGCVHRKHQGWAHTENQLGSVTQLPEDFIGRSGATPELNPVTMADPCSTPPLTTFSAEILESCIVEHQVLSQLISDVHPQRHDCAQAMPTFGANCWAKLVRHLKVQLHYHKCEEDPHKNASQNSLLVIILDADHVINICKAQSHRMTSQPTSDMH